jgi:hypothetical protein
MELTREIRDKRVAVAKDVLKQLARADVPLKPMRKVYLTVKTEELTTKGDLQAHADLIQGKCVACAIGTFFLSAVRLYDGFPMSNLQKVAGEYRALSEDMAPILESIFDTETLGAMEAFFDCRFDEYDCWDQNPRQAMSLYREAAYAGMEFGFPEQALAAICQSFIDHDGELVIPVAEPSPF